MCNIRHVQAKPPCQHTPYFALRPLTEKLHSLSVGLSLNEWPILCQYVISTQYIKGHILKCTLFDWGITIKDDSD